MSGIIAFVRTFAGVASARRRALRELEALDERMLADIGLDRGDIAAYVGSGWPWPPSPFRPRARLRASLQGCG